MKLTQIKKTNNNIGLLKFVIFKTYWSLRLTISFILGSLGIGKGQINYKKNFLLKNSNMNNGKLDEKLIKEWTNDNADNRGGFHLIERKKRLEKITDEVIREKKLQINNYQKVAPIINKLLSEDSFHINNFCHIGCRVDTLALYFAKKFPRKKFNSVDMQHNLVKVNKIIGSAKNWRVHNEYGLNYLKNCNTKLDLALFISTAVKFNNKEFELYIESLSKLGTRFIIFREPWWSQPLFKGFFKTFYPEHVPKSVSPVGGPPCDYHHNYFYFLEKYGYKVLISELNFLGARFLRNDLFIFAVKTDIANEVIIKFN